MATISLRSTITPQQDDGISGELITEKVLLPRIDMKDQSRHGSHVSESFIHLCTLDDRSIR